MGNAFALASRLTRRYGRKYNAREKAGKVIDKMLQDKPERAPLYEATMKEVERLSKEMPDLTEKLKQKDEKLLKNLETVYVKSEGENKGGFLEAKITRALLPAKGKDSELIEAPPGKYTTKSFLQLITDYQTSPVVYHHEVLAEKYKLDLQAVVNITKHVKIFDFVSHDLNKRTLTDRMTEEFIPKTFQGGIPEIMLMEEVLDERNKRFTEYQRRLKKLDEMRKLRDKDEKSVQISESKKRFTLLSEPETPDLVQVTEGKTTGKQVLLEETVKPFITEDTQKRIDNIMTEADMYAKYGVIKEDELKLLGQSEIVKRLREEREKFLAEEAKRREQIAGKVIDTIGSGENTEDTSKKVEENEKEKVPDKI